MIRQEWFSAKSWLLFVVYQALHIERMLLVARGRFTGTRRKIREYQYHWKYSPAAVNLVVFPSIPTWLSTSYYPGLLYNPSSRLSTSFFSQMICLPSMQLYCAADRSCCTNRVDNALPQGRTYAFQEHCTLPCAKGYSILFRQIKRRGKARAHQSWAVVLTIGAPSPLCTPEQVVQRK